MTGAIKRPASQFYWGDWLRDTALRSVCLGARGLWMDMLSLMHEGDPYGHLRTGQRITTPKLLARMTGASVGVVKKHLSELEEAGVFSRDKDGAIFSRRMVRDEHNRNVRAAGGKESLKNSNVPRPKDASKDIVPDDPKHPLKDTLPGGFDQSFGPSPASASASASSERAAPLGRREMYEPVQVHPRDNFRVISKVARVVRGERDWAYEGGAEDMKEEIKTRLAQHGITYDSGVISSALSSEEYKANRGCGRSSAR